MIVGDICRTHFRLTTNYHSIINYRSLPWSQIQSPLFPIKKLNILLEKNIFFTVAVTDIDTPLLNLSYIPPEFNPGYGSKSLWTELRHMFTISMSDQPRKLSKNEHSPTFSRVNYILGEKISIRSLVSVILVFFFLSI